MDFTNNEKERILNEVYSQVKTSLRPGYSLVSFLKSEPIGQWLVDRHANGPWAELGC